MSKKLSPELVAFLNAHEFTHSERHNYNYVAERIRNYGEEAGIYYFDGETRELAVHYARYYSQDRIHVQIFNENGAMRWDLIIQPVSGEYRHKKFENVTPEEQGYEVIETEANTSLFSYPLCDKASSPGQALDNFLAVETDLINSL